MSVNTTTSKFVKFQSYLYGIEISLMQPSRQPVWRFNRTFMELKSLYIKGKTDNQTRFQSYLYGIEIFGDEEKNIIFRDVSIVPLWN